MPLLLKSVLRIIRKCVGRFTPPPIRILLEFYIRMMYGYHQYASLKHLHNEANIFLQYYKGTGDVYISSAYLKYCQKNITENAPYHSIFVVNGNNARHVAELFELKDIPIITLNEIKARSLVWISRFLGYEMLDMHFLHYVSDVPMYTNFLIFLAGLNGIGFMDLYRATVFQNKNFTLPSPKWRMDEDWSKDFFAKNHLMAGKTVLLAPEAASIAEGPDASFWNKIAGALKEAGYSVCTNISHPNGKSISGTTGAFIPYEKIASFLIRGGFFIGYRSGLCDLVSSIECKKIILYPQSTWPIYGGLGIGSTLDIFSLNGMGLCDDAVELEFDNDKLQEIMAQIIDIMGG